MKSFTLVWALVGPIAGCASDRVDTQAYETYAAEVCVKHSGPHALARLNGRLLVICKDGTQVPAPEGL